MTDKPAEIHMFPCLSDNYGLLLHDPDSGLTAAIDTPDADEIAKQCEEKDWTLSHILNTHHHWDHTGGNLALKAKFPQLEIFGPAHNKENIPGMTQGIGEGDIINFGALEIHVYETPGHTLDHIIYYVPAAHSAFVGDTLFKMGCGRLFEGTPAQMFDSMAKIAALPDETLLYCAHEYTLSNGRYAQVAEPDNLRITEVMAEDRQKRDRALPTVPTTVALEKEINPFMRAKTAEILGSRRAAKDNFKG